MKSAVKSVVIGVFAALGALSATVVFAGPQVLEPANPQPDASKLKQGLAVSYAYPGDVKDLAGARAALKKGAKRGMPLVGFDYPDTLKGEMALTSTKAFQVVAGIKGFIRFDKVGVYKINFQSNDGLRVVIGGQRVALFDGRHPCESTQKRSVEVPVAGWYELDAVYFQRLGTSCLLMEWTPPGGEQDWVPNDAVAYSR